MWALFGDFRRDEAGLMRQAGLAVVERCNFGAFNRFRVKVGRRGSYASYVPAVMWPPWPVQLVWNHWLRGRSTRS